jgi:pilus assembly protein CpaC
MLWCAANGILYPMTAAGGNAPLRAERLEGGLGRMLRMPLWAPVLLFCCAVAVFLSGRDAMAQNRDLRVAVSAAQVVEFPRAARTVFIADPAIADIQVATPTSVIVFGRKPGRTTLVAIGVDDKTLAQIQVIVGHDYADLRRLILQDVPAADVKVTPTPNGVVLSGVVANDDTAEKVRAVAQRYVSDKDNVVNQLKVVGPDQVNLRVRVAEVSRTVTKQLGFNWETVVAPGSFLFGVATGRPFVTGITGLLDRALPLPNAQSPNVALFGVDTKRVSINGLIDALAEEGIVSILAQPNLTAISGQTASFLAGGEFPIPVAQSNTGGTATITIEFKPFGVRLDFVPTVLSSDRIAIKVRPEVSELSDNGAIELPGNLVIKALTVRRAETTIQLGSGESFAIAGLLQNNSNTNISKFPGLADLPIIGALFRSSRFQRNETELVIIVTPYVVRPAADGPSFRVPTDGLAQASDVERILLDRLTRISPSGAGPAGLSGVRLHGDPGFMFQ